MAGFRSWRDVLTPIRASSAPQDGGKAPCERGRATNARLGFTRRRRYRTTARPVLPDTTATSSRSTRTRRRWATQTAAKIAKRAGTVPSSTFPIFQTVTCAAREGITAIPSMLPLLLMATVRLAQQACTVKRWVVLHQARPPTRRSTALRPCARAPNRASTVPLAATLQTRVLADSRRAITAA